MKDCMALSAYVQGMSDYFGLIGPYVICISQYIRLGHFMPGVLSCFILLTSYGPSSTLTYDDVIRKIHYVGTRLSKVPGARRSPSVWVVMESVLIILLTCIVRLLMTSSSCVNLSSTLFLNLYTSSSKLPFYP